MANKWLSEEEINALLPETYSGQIKNINGEFIDVTFERVGSYIRDLGGNNTNMVVTWFNANTPPDQHGRLVTRYNASISGISLPSNPLDRIIKVNLPLYTSNVKYIEVPVLCWIDLGAAASLSYDTSRNGSFETYNRNGVQSQIFSLPSTDGTKIGTTRINNNEGVSVFRNLFEINEELGDQPISIDFLEMQYTCVYSEGGVVSFWISQICVNDDATFPDTPQPEEQGGNWGEDTDKAGGDGTFNAPSDNDGDRGGTSLLSAISTANTTFKTVLGGNYNLYYVPPADLTKILAVLYSSDYFQRFENSMYNPLSAVLNCALIPEIFCSYSASVSDMTAGGYNVSQHIFPNPVQFASPEPLIMRHIGDIDITKYFGAFPDFAPYTQCKLHLPYIGEITIDTNKIAGGTLSVDYVCDVLSGNVTAWIWCNDKDGNHTYCYNATGNCAYSIPLFANSSDGSAIGKIIGGIASIAAGNVFSGVASTASGAASAMSRHTQISGTFSGNVGMTTNPKCFAEFSRPQWANPANYQNQSGIPSQISGKLSDFRGGFVQVETIDLQCVPATEAELAEIESLLESGIYYVSN